MKVNVTQDCIDNAIRKNSHHCMIADAIHIADPEAKYVVVDLQSIRWSNLYKGQRYTAFTPPKAQSRLLAWDSGKQIKPFAFTVNAVTVKPIGWKATHPNSTRSGKKYKSTGKPRKVRVEVQREFGVRIFAES